MCWVSWQQSFKTCDTVESIEVYKENMISKMMKNNGLRQLCTRFISLAIVFLAVGTILLGSAESSMAYSIDYGMDQARGDKTIEYYGEGLRDIVEQTLRNNVDHPDSKATAENSYKRESALNKVLPKQRRSAFSKEDLMKLRKTDNPRDLVRK